MLGVFLGGCFILNREPHRNFFSVIVVNGTKSPIQMTVSKGHENREETILLGPGERNRLAMYFAIANAKKEFLYPGGLNGLKWRNDKKQTGQLDAEQMKSLCKVDELESFCVITITDALFNLSPNP